MQAVRSQHPKLISYLLSNTTFPKILDWLFTEAYIKSQSYNQIARLSLLLFESSPAAVQKALRQQPLFINRMQGYVKTSSFSKPMLSGFFQRVFESAVKQTDGKFLNQFQGFSKILVSNIQTVAGRDLFIHLSLDFPEHFQLSSDVLSTGLDNIEYTHIHLILTAYKSILNLRPTYYHLFSDPDVAKKLLPYAINPSTPLVLSVQAFQILNSSQLDQSLIDNYKYDFTREIDGRTPYALQLFRTFVPQYCLDLITNVHPFMNDSVLLTLENCTDISAFVTENNVLNQIIDNYWISKTNPHITKLAQFIDARLPDSLKTVKWRSFINEGVAHRISLQTTNYGGTVIKRNSRFAYNDEPENEDPIMGHDSGSSDDEYVFDIYGEPPFRRPKGEYFQDDDEIEDDMF